MIMWENIEMNIGSIFEDDNIRTIFNFTGDCIPQDVKLHPSCGCTGATWMESTNEVHVGYNAGKIPRHLTENHMNIRKSIRITYLCNGIEYNDTLYINGIVNKKL